MRDQCRRQARTLHRCLQDFRHRPDRHLRLRSGLRVCGRRLAVLPLRRSLLQCHRKQLPASLRVWSSCFANTTRCVIEIALAHVQNTH